MNPNNVISGGADARTVVLFHRDADGFASAFAAWCALGTDGVRYESVQYGEPVPTIVQGARVFIVDFSYPREVLLSLIRRTCDLTVLDHHKTAAKELEGMACALFDMSKAGCQLSWEYFSQWANIGPNAPAAELLAQSIPPLLEAVADRDLWRFEYPSTEALCARLEIEPWDFARWHDLAMMGAADLVRFLGEGEVIVAYKKTIAESQAKRWHWLQLRGMAGPVPACNAAYMGSETAHELIRKNPFHDVVAVYAVEKDGWRVSLRGSGNVDVSEIARRYDGGGGHKDAAGFMVKTREEIGEPVRFDLTPEGTQEPLEREVRRFVLDYEMEGETASGADKTHYPSGFEQCLLYDAIQGVIADEPLMREWLAWWSKRLPLLKRPGRLAGPGVDLIAAERERQVAKGFDGDHDDAHTAGTLAQAARCVLAMANGKRFNGDTGGLYEHPPIGWPWHLTDWQRIVKHDWPELLVIAGALVAAEIDRVERLKGETRPIQQGRHPIVDTKVRVTKSVAGQSRGHAVPMALPDGRKVLVIFDPDWTYAKSPNFGDFDVQMETEAHLVMVIGRLRGVHVLKNRTGSTTRSECHWSDVLARMGYDVDELRPAVDMALGKEAAL